MDNMDRRDLENIVRKILLETLDNCGTCQNISSRLPSGVMSVKLPLIKPEKFDTGKAGDNVLLKDAFTLRESPRLGCGIMEMRQTTFDWFLNYDEIDYVIEGRLEINIDGGKVGANKGEIILIPKGSKIQFCVPDYAKFMYVSYPADWANQ